MKISVNINKDVLDALKDLNAITHSLNQMAVSVGRTHVKQAMAIENYCHIIRSLCENPDDAYVAYCEAAKEHHPPRFPQLPYYIELIISYCDNSHHEGTGYRASNFRSVGVTSDCTKEVYVYRLPAPRWEWCLDDADVPAQMPLFEDIPIKW
jgi:hypothetical protein